MGCAVALPCVHCQARKQSLIACIPLILLIDQAEPVSTVAGFVVSDVPPERQRQTSILLCNDPHPVSEDQFEHECVNAAASLHSELFENVPGLQMTKRAIRKAAANCLHWD
jgi:hypothetical protein